MVTYSSVNNFPEFIILDEKHTSSPWKTVVLLWATSSGVHSDCSYQLETSRSLNRDSPQNVSLMSRQQIYLWSPVPPPPLYKACLCCLLRAKLRQYREWLLQHQLQQQNYPESHPNRNTAAGEGNGIVALLRHAKLKTYYCGLLYHFCLSSGYKSIMFAICTIIM